MKTALKLVLIIIPFAGLLLGFIVYFRSTPLQSTNEASRPVEYEEEMIRIIRSIPAEKAEVLLDFARYIKWRYEVTSDDSSDLTDKTSEISEPEKHDSVKQLEDKTDKATDVSTTPSETQ